MRFPTHFVFSICLLFLCGCEPSRQNVISKGSDGAQVEMVSGPDLTVTYDAALWRPRAPINDPKIGGFQSMTWALQDPEWAQIRVESRPERMTGAECKQRILDNQNFRGDPAQLVREGRESLAGRDWLVLEFRNRHTRPTRSEIHYFLSTGDGHVNLFSICEEGNLAKHREVIKAFLHKVQVK